MCAIVKSRVEEELMRANGYVTLAIYSSCESHVYKK